MEIKTSVVLDENIRMTGKGHTEHEVKIDYIPPFGEDKGFMSTELLLISLSSCSGHCILLLLRQMKKSVAGLEILGKGNRREEHPTVFTDIELDYRFKGGDLDEAAVEKAIHMTKETLCPVWAMLKDSVEISWKYSIAEG
jgi:putative redox protein